MIKLKVLAVAPDPNDGCAWWRVISPLSVLRDQSNGEFDFVAVPEATHSMISAFDLLLLQRPVRDCDKRALQWAKRLGIPVVVDYDDDYLEVPKHNRMHHAYSAHEVKENVRFFLSSADLVTVSTFALKKAWQPYNRKIAIVPNGFDDRLVRAEAGAHLPYRRVVWRGGDSHIKDVARYSNAMVHAAQLAPQAIWTFVGHSFYELHDKFPQGTMMEYPFSDVLGWFRTLGELDPKILIVPLDDTDFNHKKSNISIMEGAWAGAAVLAPDWDDWRAPGVTNYKNPREFADKLIELLHMTDGELRAKANDTWTAVRSNLLVSRANKLRVMLYATLCAQASTKRIKPLNTEPDKLDEITKQKLTQGEINVAVHDVGASEGNPSESIDHSGIAESNKREAQEDQATSSA